MYGNYHGHNFIQAEDTDEPNNELSYHFFHEIVPVACYNILLLKLL